MSDADRVDRLSALERVKAACAAAQARITADFAESQAEVAVAWRRRARECADDNDFDGWRSGAGTGAARDGGRRGAGLRVVPAARRRPSRTRGRGGRSGGPGSAGVTVARRTSPGGGAGAGASPPPHAGGARGRRAERVARGDRRPGDGSPRRPSTSRRWTPSCSTVLGLEGVGRLGDRELVRRVRAIAYRLDAESVLARCRGAEEQRRVSIRPAPDTMCYVTAYLPVAQGVAVHAALTARGGRRASG